MTTRKVLQFYVEQDDFFEFGDPQILDLTDDELGALNKEAGEPVLLENRNGFFRLVDE
jgi:hypothetical protein